MRWRDAVNELEVTPLDVVQFSAGWVAFLGVFIWQGWGWAGFFLALLAGACVHLVFAIGRAFAGAGVSPI